MDTIKSTTKTTIRFISNEIGDKHMYRMHEGMYEQIKWNENKNKIKS